MPNYRGIVYIQAIMYFELNCMFSYIVALTILMNRPIRSGLLNCSTSDSVENSYGIQKRITNLILNAYKYYFNTELLHMVKR